MHTTIIFAHPYHGSFNKAILNSASDALKANSKEYVLIDLYKEGFDPVLSERELAVYSEGKALDPKVKAYRDILAETDEIVLIFPIWWYDFPAILKGFFDKVMLPGSAFREDSDGMHPLRSIGRTFILTTSSAPTQCLVEDLGDTVNQMMIAATFKAIGFQNAEWFNFGTIGNSNEEERKAFLTEVAAAITKH